MTSLLLLLLSRAMTSRPLYVPHLGQARWGSLGLLHCGQKLAVSTLSFCWARRESRLLFEVFLLGTGIVFSFLDSRTLYFTVAAPICPNVASRATLVAVLRSPASFRSAPHTTHSPRQSSRHRICDGQGLGDGVAHPALEVEHVAFDVRFVVVDHRSRRRRRSRRSRPAPRGRRRPDSADRVRSGCATPLAVSVTRRPTRVAVRCRSTPPPATS